MRAPAPPACSGASARRRRASVERRRVGRRAAPAVRRHAAPSQRRSIDTLLSDAADGERLSPDDGDAALRPRRRCSTSAPPPTRAAARCTPTASSPTSSIATSTTPTSASRAAGSAPSTARPPAEGYVLSREELAQKLQETVDLGGVQILLQGGLNPDLPLDWYEDLFRWMKANFPLAIHGLSPEEIRYIAEIEGCRSARSLERLIAAGLDSIPGGGAEILVDEIRHADLAAQVHDRQWLEVMRRAHALGLRTTATMMYGFGDSRATASTTSSSCASCRTRPPASPRSSAGRSRPRGRASSCTTTPRPCATCACSRSRASSSTTSPACRSPGRRWGRRSGQVGAALRRQRLRLGDDRGERRLAGGRHLQAAAPRTSSATSAAPASSRAAATCATSGSGVRPEPERNDAMRMVSAPWVVPIDRSRRSPTARWRSTTSDTVLVVGPRAEVRARSIPGPPRSAPRGSLLPALVNAHCHLELSALAGAVPGGGGLIAWAQQLVRAGRATLDRARAAAAAAAAAAEMVARRHGRRRRRRQQPGSRAGDRRGRPARRPFPRAGRLARRARRRRAGRRRPRARGGRLAHLARRPRLRAGAARPLLRRTRAASARSSHVAARAGVPTSVHVAEDATSSPLLRDGSGALAGRARARWASTRRPASPGRPPVAYLASLGAFDTAGAAAAGAHGARRRRRPPPRARGRRDRRSCARDPTCTSPVTCPTSARCSTTASTWRWAPTAWRRSPTCRCGARSRPWRRAFRACPPPPGSTPPRAAAPRRCELAPLGSLTPGKRPGIIEVTPATTARTRTPEAALVGDPHPAVRWRAAA